MDTPRQAIRNYFSKLGLEAEVADIYLALHAHGPQNISTLSRNARVERTRIYRLIDRLLESNLIELESSGRRGVIIHTGFAGPDHPVLPQLAEQGYLKALFFRLA